MDPMKVVPDHMKWILNNVFSETPRNHKFDIKNGLGWKDTMSGYIWYKFGSLGYLTCHQAFKARQFRHEFDEVVINHLFRLLGKCIKFLKSRFFAYDRNFYLGYRVNQKNPKEQT